MHCMVGPLMIQIFGLIVLIVNDDAHSLERLQESIIFLFFGCICVGLVFVNAETHVLMIHIFGLIVPIVNDHAHKDTKLWKIVGIYYFPFPFGLDMHGPCVYKCSHPYFDDLDFQFNCTPCE